MQPEHSRDYTIHTQLMEARQQLDRAKSLLLSETPSYAEGTTAALEAIRQSLRAFLSWHSLDLPEDAPLSAIGRSAVALGRTLETRVHLALPIERLESELREKKNLNINDREAARSAYYIARNMLSAVAGELPVYLYPTSKSHTLQDQAV